MDKISDLERRRFVRARRQMWVEHKLHHRNHKPVLDQWHWALSCDMSLNGVLFNTEILYHKEDILDIRVTAAGTIDVLKGLARVVRVISRPDGLYSVAVGLLFLENSSSRKQTSKK